MLKLERGTDLSHIAILMREKERFFEPVLLKALAIALFLHCGALILFHVTPFSFASTFNFPPVHVQSDVPFVGVSVLSSEDDKGDDLSLPPLSFVPSLEWAFIAPQLTLSASLAFDASLLEPLEKGLWPKWEEPLSFDLQQPFIQLSFSGDLAELPLIWSDPILNQMQPMGEHSVLFVTYDVQLDEKTGEIFWYEPKENSKVKEVDQLTEKILLSLKFSPTGLGETIKGAVHFAVLHNLNN